MNTKNVIEWKAVDGSRQAELPQVWNKLAESGFNPVLLERVRRFAISEKENGTLGKYQEFLTILGESYKDSAFNRNIFDKYNPTLSKEQLGMLDALDELSGQFAGLIPATLWNTLASMIVRPDAEKEDSILNVQEFLTYPWYVCDANLHALGVAYGLFFHVQSALVRHSGRAIFHGCGCNHYIGGAQDVHISYTMPQEKMKVSAKEFLDHLLGQTSLIVEKGYPFRLNDESAGSAKVMAMEPGSLSVVSREQAK